MKADVSIAQSSGNYKIKVAGRASFECSPPLRNLAKMLENETFNQISIDLSKCEAMDSTFMGVLAMLGLRAMKKKAPIEILNAGEANLELLNGLGLKKLFTFKNEELEEDGLQSVAGQDTEDKERTVLEAHEVLMDVDEENVPKFEKVVELVRKDLED